MAEPLTPMPPAHSSRMSRRGALPLALLTVAVVLIAYVAWYSLDSSPREVSTPERSVVRSDVATPPRDDVAAPPTPLGAQGVETVLPPRRVADSCGEDRRENWSSPGPDATEPWLRVHLADATTGAPLESAIVRVAASAEALAAQDKRVTSARAGASGIATLWDPPLALGRDLPWILATAKRHAPALLPITAAVPSGTHAFAVRGRTIELPLPVAPPLKVRVLRRDERGGAVAIEGARVVARAPWAEEADFFAGMRDDTELRRLLTLEGTTDAKGEASFAPLARQPWRIHVAAIGCDSEDFVISAAEAQHGLVEVVLRELWVAAVALPANGLTACPGLQWDGTPAWFAEEAIEWQPDHLTQEERAASTAGLARRPHVAETLAPGDELRVRFATLHSAVLAEGRPDTVRAKAQVLAGELPVDVTLSFVPFESFGAGDVFPASAPRIGAPGRVRLTWSGAPEAPARFVGSLVRNRDDDGEIRVRGVVGASGELNLDLPPGTYELDGRIGDHMLFASFDVHEEEDVSDELSRGASSSTPCYLAAAADRIPLVVRDALGRRRLHYELTREPSDVRRWLGYDRAWDPRRAWRPEWITRPWFVSRIRTQRERCEPDLPPMRWTGQLSLFTDRNVEWTEDLTLEAFGCVPAEFPRVRFSRNSNPAELELALDESPTTSW